MYSDFAQVEQDVQFFGDIMAYIESNRLKLSCCQLEWLAWFERLILLPPGREFFLAATRARWSGPQRQA